MPESSAASKRFSITAPDGSAFEIEDEVPHSSDPYGALKTPQDVLDYYNDNGYVVVRNVIPAELCDQVRAAFAREVKSYRGYIYRQTTANPERHLLTPGGYMLNPILNIQDLHEGLFGGFKSLGMEIITHPKLQQAGRSLLGEPAKVVQSMYFEGNPSTWPHQDTYYLDSSDIGRMTAAWIALEDIKPGAGRFFIYPGSHKIDLARNGGDFNIAFHHERYKKLIVELIQRMKLRCHAPALRKGDVLFWSAKTIHGSLETRQPQYSRSSITAHLIPASTDFLQHQSRKKPLRLRSFNDVQVHCPKDQNRAVNRAILLTETSFPKTFQLAKRWAVKFYTR